MHLCRQHPRQGTRRRVLRPKPCLGVTAGQFLRHGQSVRHNNPLGGFHRRHGPRRGIACQQLWQLIGVKPRAVAAHWQAEGVEQQPAAQRPAGIGAVANGKIIGHANSPLRISRNASVLSRQREIPIFAVDHHGKESLPAPLELWEIGPLIVTSEINILIQFRVSRVVLGRREPQGVRMPLDGIADRSMSRKAMKAELLDAETELRLAYAWRDQRDEEALHRLINAYMRLAISVASKFRRYGAPMNDLIQEAGLGLMRAADKFDPDRGVRFSTYAVWWIRAGVQDYVMRNWSMVRTGSTSSQKSLFFNMKRVAAKLEREAAARGERLDGHQLRAQIAHEVGVPLGDVEMMEGRLAGSDYSLNATQSNEDEGREWIDALEDDASQAAEIVEEAHDAETLHHWLQVALQALTARERYIVSERKLRDEPRTLESLGEELRLSKERVRQLEAVALNKMRKSLDGQSAEVRAFFV
ncbi:RNA polymerase sigma factor RpoH [mine drainage metagenome]|uniref:RNA polymerase sigma factor RpoH n=1 Tax=mine drainage metagenome TaxID=410659 RepID=A0A1J5PSU6_9ZZZZ